MEYWFWTILTFLTLTWYLVVTVIVGVKGGKDIQEMLSKLGSKDKAADDDDSP